MSKLESFLRVIFECGSNWACSVTHPQKMNETEEGLFDKSRNHDDMATITVPSSLGQDMAPSSSNLLNTSIESTTTTHSELSDGVPSVIMDTAATPSESKMIIIDHTNEDSIRNYLIDTLSKASLAIKYDVMDNQPVEAKKLYREVATKFDQLSPFVPQQYSKVLSKYSKLYSDRSQHLAKQQVIQQQQFNNDSSNPNNTNQNTGNNATQQPASVGGNNTLSNILTNHKKIKKSVKEINSELHDYLYNHEKHSSSVSSTNQQTNPKLIIHNPMVLSDNLQFIEEEIPTYSNEFQPPSGYRHKPFWLMNRLCSTMLNGGYLVNDLYISKKVWFQKGAKLYAQQHKIVFCQRLSDCISEFKTEMIVNCKTKQDDVKSIDYKTVITLLDRFIEQTGLLQRELTKYVNLTVPVATVQPMTITSGEGGFFGMFQDEESEELEEETKPQEQPTTETANYNIDQSQSFSNRMFGFGKSLYKTISNTIKGGTKEETSDRPYIPWLIQVFNNVPFFDEWLTIYEDMLRNAVNNVASNRRVVEDLRSIVDRFEKISLFFSTCLCAFVLQDLQLLLERYIKKCRDSMSKLFVTKNIPFLENPNK